MDTNGPIVWTDSTRRLSELIPWPRNPRKIKDESAKRLQDSFEEFGQPEPVVIGPNNELYNGHQRLKSWMQKFGDVDVAVRVASRALAEKEREKLTVYLHKGATGEWDFEMLATEFSAPDLVEWGFEPGEIGMEDGGEPIDFERFFEKVNEDHDAKQGMEKIVLEYTTEDAEAVKAVFKERGETPENIVWELLGL